MIRTTSNTNAAALPSSRAGRSLPRDLHGVELHDVVDELDGTVGIIEDPRRGQLVACVQVEGGSFAMAPSREQELRLQRWGDLVATVAHASSVVHRIGFVSRSIPSDSNRQLDYFERSADPNAGSVIRASYLELLERYERTADQREVLVWIATARPSAKAERAERRDALGAEVMRLCHLLNRAEIHVTHVLDRIDLALAIRATYDPWGRADRLEYARRVREESPERVGDLLEIAPADLDPKWFKRRPGKPRGYLQADRGLHCTGWVRQWPTTEVGALFLMPLIVNPNVVRSVAWSAELDDPARALHDINVKALDARDDQIAHARMQQRPTITRQRKWQGVLEREQELGAGHAKVRHNAYVTTSVLGSDVAALDQAWERTRQNAASAQLQLEVMPVRQDQAITLTAPLGRGLR